MYISVAICDDDLILCADVERMLGKIFRELSLKYNIDVYNSGEPLCHEMQHTKYDIIFLDIELPGMNGVKTGKYIRENLKNEIVQIAYISAREDYAMELFDYRPINFLVKPLDEIKLRKVINKYLVITEQDNHIFTYKKGFEFFTVPMSDILYFESKNRKVAVITRDGHDEFYNSMDNVYSMVKTNRFLFIHKSIIVNFKYIKKLGYAEVVLTNGVVLPISQSRRKQTRQMYMEIKMGEI